jgi:Icc-related predicted phosphoesterase
MNIACVSDLHENLIEIPECDILLIAGDITYGLHNDRAAQQEFLYTRFKNWVESVPARHVVAIAGNHDQSVEDWGWPVKDEWPSKFHYLQDEGVEIEGIKIWGTPWQPWFYSWAFNAPENNGESFLKEKFDMIPRDTDIVICHGPPYGYGDRVGDQRDLSAERVGSKALAAALRDINPRLMVCGHIHAGTGDYRLHGKQTRIINAAVVNQRYEVKRGPFMVRLQPDKRTCGFDCEPNGGPHVCMCEPERKAENSNPMPLPAPNG